METFEKFIKSVPDKRVVVWGLGLNRGGLEAAKYFADKGARVVVVDLRSREELKESLMELSKYQNIDYVFGRQEEDIFRGADLVIKNPAIPWELPLVKKLLAKGCRIETDVTLFFRFFKGRIIGITGSKGKTTTTVLISKILKAAGKDILLAGNLRVSLFSFLKKNYLSDSQKIAALEMSSFQLEDLVLVKRSPNIAIVTNILRDHLNRYGTYAKYAAAKKNICLFQKKSDYVVLNKEDKKLRTFAKGKGKTIWFSQSSPCFVIPAQAGIQKEIKKINGNLHSKNNQANLAAALTVAKIFRIKQSVIANVIKNFKGVPYRMEKIAKIKGITFYNDTAATIPDAAINNLKSFDKKIILISGGADKKLKFNQFAKVVAKRVKRAILLPGTATPLIEKSFKLYASKVNCNKVSSMDKAVKLAYKSAEPGDAVLLSPGCASFGLFKNEFDRGDQFNEAVKKLNR